MSLDEIKKLLDLDAKPASHPRMVEVDYHPATGTTVLNDEPIPQPTALKLDPWDLSKGKEVIQNQPEIKRSGLSPEAVADFFGAAFLNDPQLHDKCTDELRHQFIKTALETPETHALRESTVLNTFASELACHHFTQEFVKLAEKEKERSEKRSGKPAKDAGKEAMRQEMAVLRAAGKAVRQAKEEVDEANDMESALGMGGDGGRDGRLDAGQVAARFKRVKNHPLLRRICELAGRYRMVAQARQRQKVKHGLDGVVGVELGGDVGRLLPVELAQLAIPELELHSLRRLVERQMMQREHRGVEKVGKGPIVVCVDESGSMGGEPVCQAKGFALAMAWVARHQNRYCCLIGYSGATEGTKLVIPPGKTDDKALMDWLEHFYSGGTDMDVPLEKLPQWWDTEIKAPKGKTDVVLITDAICRVPPDMERNFLDWKKREQARVITLLVGGYGDPGDLKRVSDEWFSMRNIGLDQEGVQRCLSL